MPDEKSRGQTKTEAKISGKVIARQSSLIITSYYLYYTAGVRQRQAKSRVGCDILGVTSALVVPEGNYTIRIALFARCVC